MDRIGSWLVSIVGLWVWLVSGAASADFVLQFADSSGLEVTEYSTIEVGQTVDVYVYLLQQDPSTLLTDEGIFSAAFRLDYAGAESLARVLAPTDVRANSAFDFDNQVTLVSGGVNVDLSSLSMNFGTPADPNRMLLASLRLTALSAGIVQLGFQDIDTNTDGFLAGNGDAFDGSVLFTRSATLRVTATPEPGSIMLMLIASGMVALRRRRAGHLPRRSRGRSQTSVKRSLREGAER